MADQRYNRVDLARELLDDALSLFLERQSFVSALTLAGAAAEILSKELSHRGEQDSLERKYKALEPIHAMLHGRPLSREEFIRDENRALIAVTHMATASEPSVTLDLEEAALSMIARACENSDLLGLPRTGRMHEFENYFYEHVVGV